MVEFLAPLGWLVACLALVPIGSAILRDRRESRVRHRLGLAAPRPAARVATAAAAALAIGLLAAATARPALRTVGAQPLRTDAQVFFVVDISRSMLASRSPHGATRYARALATAEAVRDGLGDVPAGVASLTDRPLPHLFPTGDRAVFSAVLHQAIGLQRPPPESGIGSSSLATSFDPLAQLATAGYFPASAKHRLAILLSDGESDLYTPQAVATELRAERVGLLIVRFWHADERVYTARGRQEVYRPDPQSLRPLETLAARTAGRRVFGENERAAIVRAAHAWLGRGPTVATAQPRRFELAPYAALAAVFPLAFVVWRRDPR
jgi:hypothetical protein